LGRILKRRGFIAALLSSIAWPAWAQKWAIFQDQGPGSLPAGVALVAIDGGQTYYATNGFIQAANAGYDTTMFPTVGWFPGVGSIADVKTWQACGVNAILGITSNVAGTLTWLGPAGIANG
jgi:hypothetical protein